MKVACAICGKIIGERKVHLPAHTVYEYCPKCFREYYPKEDLLNYELYCFVCGHEGRHYIDEWPSRWELVCRRCGATTLFGKER